MSKKSQLVSRLSLGLDMLSIADEIRREMDIPDEVFHRLATPDGRKDWRRMFEEMIEVEAPQKPENRILHLISGGKDLILDSTDGSETLAMADEVFSYISPAFKDLGTDEPSKPTGEMPVEVYEMESDAEFTAMFGSLSSDVSRLIFTQSQIKGFARKYYRNWLRPDGYGAFLLFRSRGNLLVAFVRVRSGGSLGVDADRFKSPLVWRARSRRWVVVPKLAVSLTSLVRVLLPILSSIRQASCRFLAVLWIFLRTFYCRSFWSPIRSV